jgi:NADH-quinone oxidoreductase subunit L
VTPSAYFLSHAWLVPLVPLLTALLLFFLGRALPKSVISVLCVASMFLSFAFSLGAILQLLAFPSGARVYQQILFDWVVLPGLPVGNLVTPLVAECGYLLDPLSAVMILVIAGIGLLIYIYSVGYMSHEPGYYRYFGLLNLFSFFMLTLVLANNLVLFFVGWEGASLCAYFLISFHFLKNPAMQAGLRTFLVNRLTGVAVLLGIFLVAITTGTVRFTSEGLSEPHFSIGIFQLFSAQLNQGVLSSGAPILTAIALLFLVGAIGKSAQFPLHAWLPDAAVAPVPFSAFVHSAAMVTSGVYLIARMNFVYQLSPFAMNTVALIGATTAIFAAFLALLQTDVKKVLAYSTLSQVGLMFLALGVGAFAAGIFQLMTHAFMKSLLFLAAGSVIHALSGESDLRKMGGLWNTMPSTSRPFLIATLALAGMPPLAGFFSKNEILSHVYARSAGLDGYLILWIVGVLTAGLTSLYIFRLLFLAFFGRSRVPVEIEGHIRETPKAFAFPLMLLAFLSIAGGWLALPVLWGEESPFARFLAPVFPSVSPQRATTSFAANSLQTEYVLMAASAVIALFAVLLAYNIYIKHPKRHIRIAEALSRLTKWGATTNTTDNLFDILFVNRLKDLSLFLYSFDLKLIQGLTTSAISRAARLLSRVSTWWDEWIIDGLFNFVAKVVTSFSVPFRMFQTGSFSSYAVLILLGLVILLGYYGHHVQYIVRNAH